MVLLAVAAGTLSLLRRQNAAAPAKTSVPSTLPQSGGSTVSLPGRVEAVELAAVPVPFDGRIESLFVNVGQEVYEGELLAEIRSSELLSQREASQNDLNRLSNRVATLESTLIAARLEAARAQQVAGASRTAMDDAQKVLLRQQMLYSKGAASRQAAEKAQAAFDAASDAYQGLQKVAEMADKRVAELAKDLDTQQQEASEGSKELEDNTTAVASGDVRAPVDGYVVARKGQVGDEVTTDIQDLFLIAVNMTQLRVVLEPPPPVLDKIRAGQDAIIQVAELAEGVESKVTDVRGGQAIIEFTSPNPVIKPGMTVQVVIKLT
jgi:multidrug resistance efflux pump